MVDRLFQAVECSLVVEEVVAVVVGRETWPSLAVLCVGPLQILEVETLLGVGTESDKQEDSMYILLALFVYQPTLTLFLSSEHQLKFFRPFQIKHTSHDL